MASKRTGKIEKNTAQRMSDPIRPRLLPLKAAAEYLGLTTWAMRVRIWNGDLPVVQFKNGRKMYLDRYDLDHFIEQNKRMIT